VVLAARRPRRHPSVGRAHEGLAGELQALLGADPVAQRREVAVLKGRDLKLGLVQAGRPLVDRPRLRYHHQLRTGEGESPHVLGEVAVVADRHSDPPDRGLVDRRARVTGRVVALLVEAWVVGDVHHPRAAEERAVGVDDRRAVVASPAVALVEVQYDHHSERGGAGREGLGHGTGHRLSQRARVASRRPLRVEGLEGQLREADQLGASPRRRLEGLEAAAKIVAAVGARVLLDESDLHSVSFSTQRRAVGSACAR
jgi:hypothetical protein